MLFMLRESMSRQIQENKVGWLTKKKKGWERKQIIERERKMSSLLRNRSGLEDDRTTYGRLAFLLYNFT